MGWGGEPTGRQNFVPDAAISNADEPLPDPAAIGYMRQRIGELINANLRYTYGQ